MERSLMDEYLGVDRATVTLNVVFNKAQVCVSFVSCIVVVMFSAASTYAGEYSARCWKNLDLLEWSQFSRTSQFAFLNSFAFFFLVDFFFFFFFVADYGIYS